MFVLDASAFIMEEVPKKGKCVTVKEVVKEAKKRLVLTGVDVMEPKKGAVDRVLSEAKATGDIHSLSNADLKVLALALSIKNSILLTDDFAVQNTAEELGIKWESASGKKIKDKVKWVLKCKGCKRRIKKSPCPVCGHEGYRVRASTTAIE